MSMRGLMKVGLWLTALLLTVEPSQEWGGEVGPRQEWGGVVGPRQEWGGEVGPRQECGLKEKFFCPAGFYCNLVGSGCIPKDQSSYSKPVSLNNKTSVFLHNIRKIVTVINNNKKTVSFLNNNSDKEVSLPINNNGKPVNLISGKNGTTESLLKINNGKLVTNLNNSNVKSDNDDKPVSLLNNNDNNGKPVSIRMINSNSNITGNLVNNMTQMNSNSTNDVDENEAIEDHMGSFTAPSQGPLPVIIGGTVAVAAALALAAYLTCARRTPRGYQNI